MFGCCMKSVDSDDQRRNDEINGSIKKDAKEKHKIKTVKLLLLGMIPSPY